MNNVSAQASFVGKKIPNAAKYSDSNFKLVGFTVGVSAKVVELNFDQSLAGTTISVVGGPKFKVGNKYLPRNGVPVHANFSLPKGTRLNPGFEPVWSGILGSDFVARLGDDVLIKMAEGDSFDIFYPNGVVALVSAGLMPSGHINVVVKPLEPSVALEKRLRFVTKMFDKASGAEQSDARAIKQDRTYHELAAMLLLTGIHTDFRKEICMAVGAAVKNYGPLRPAVKNHFLRVLHTLDDTHSYWWLGNSSAGIESSDIPAQKAGKPATEKARKAKRASDDSRERAQMKGPPRNDDSVKHGNKKKGGKK